MNDQKTLDNYPDNYNVCPYCGEEGALYFKLHFTLDGYNFIKWKCDNCMGYVHEKRKKVEVK